MVVSEPKLNLKPEDGAQGYKDYRSDMMALHRATLSLFSDLSLEGVLRRVIHAARELSGARYAALGLPGEDGSLETFITVGLSRAEVARIEHEPEGHGLIGEMLRAGQSIRIPEISGHPRASGFPAGMARLTKRRIPATRGIFALSTTSSMTRKFVMRRVPGRSASPISMVNLKKPSRIRPTSSAPFTSSALSTRSARASRSVRTCSASIGRTKLRRRVTTTMVGQSSAV